MEIFAGDWGMGNLSVFSKNLLTGYVFQDCVDWREGKKHLTVYGKPISLVWDVCASRNGIITGWGYLLTTFEGDL